MTGTPSLDDLKRKAAAGDLGAHMTLAHKLDMAGDHASALSALHAAAEKGFAPARYVLGARYLVGRAAPFNPSEGARLVAAAALGGQVEAQRLMSVIAAVSGSWRDALLHLQQAAKNGDASAKAQLTLLQARDGLDLSFWTGAATINWKQESPRIGVVDRFISHDICRWLIDRAKPKLEAARIRDPKGGVREDGYRTNSGMGFGLLDSDLVLQLVQARISATIGVPTGNQEPTNILHYAQGEAYRPHYDFVDPDASAHAQELKVGGQRVITFLVYLNDDFEGGETDFPRLNWRFKGKAGDALVFHNIAPDGSPELDSLHAGLPPTSGEKWLLSKWVRERPTPLV